MKQITLLFMLCVYAFSQDVSSMIDKLAEYKIEKRALRITYSPFAVDATKQEAQSSLLGDAVSVTFNGPVLKAVLNKKAFVDNAWYGVGEKIGKYKIKSIYESGIVLEDGKITKTLMLDIAKKYLKVKDR